jgi:putative ABC transport system permease protein
MGGMFGGLNTMYAAFSARFREIGMLQSLGYSRRAIVLSFMQESLLISAIGALIGSALSLIVLDGIAIRINLGAFGLVLDTATIAMGLAAGLFLTVTALLIAGCTTTDEDSDLPWNTQQPWEGSVAIPGFNGGGDGF